MVDISIFFLFPENHGIATVKGDQTTAKIIVDILAENRNFALALDIYNNSHAWPNYIPEDVVKRAIIEFTKGITNTFDLVFKENDTKISRDTLITCMCWIQYYSKKDARLSWMNAITDMGEMDKDFDEFINPWDVLKNIDMTI